MEGSSRSPGGIGASWTEPSYPNYLISDMTTLLPRPLFRRFVVEYTSSAQEALRRMVHRHLLGAAAYDARHMVSIS